MKALLTALALTLAAAPATAQMPAPAGPKAGESFAFLTGRWTGEGWIQMGPQRYAFRQTERVAPMLDGSIMTIEGKGVDPADPKVVHHHAFAILSWNPEAQRYDFRSYAGGRAGTYAARLISPGSFVWEIDMPGGRIRYTAKVEGNRWVEDGEIKRGDADWRPFFHMELKRVTG